MRFPLAWSLRKVLLAGLAWPVVLLGISLWADVANLEARRLPTYSVVSVFFEHHNWPVWLYFVAWLPVSAFVIWRIVLPPITRDHSHGAV